MTLFMAGSRWCPNKCHSAAETVNDVHLAVHVRTDVLHEWDPKWHRSPTKNLWQISSLNQQVATDTLIGRITWQHKTIQHQIHFCFCFQPLLWRPQFDSLEPGMSSWLPRLYLAVSEPNSQEAHWISPTPLGPSSFLPPRHGFQAGYFWTWRSHGRWAETGWTGSGDGATTASSSITFTAVACTLKTQFFSPVSHLFRPFCFNVS